MRNTLRKPIVITLVCAQGAAFAQQRPQLPGDYPNRPIRVIVAAAPGGGTDLMSRLIMGKVGERWGNPFVVDNRSGAGGTIGVDLVAKAPANGYTLLTVAMSGLATVPLLSKVPYDPQQDFVPVSEFAAQSSVLAIAGGLPVNSVKELIAHAKSKPGVLNAATTGIGTSTHLTMELFKSMAGIDVANISYKGTGETMIALIGGQVDLLFGAAPGVTPHAKSGKVKMLAVTSLKRSAFLPDLPTLSEAGVPGFEVTGWYGLLAPAGTSPAIVTALNREINQILNLPDVKAKLADDGAEITPGSPQQFRDTIAKEIVKWRKLLKESNLKL